MRLTTTAPQHRRHIGDQAEQLVAEHFERAGYEIRDRNVRCRGGELDVVAQKGSQVVFIEVRMRSSSMWGDPAASVMGPKQRRVVLAALEYCQRHRLFHRDLRFDVASVVGRGRDGLVEVIENAFEAGF